jgi:hypothetical protein
MTSTPATPFVFASELHDGQVIIDPQDGAVRTVTGEITGLPHDRVRIMSLGGVELILWRHTPVDLVDVDQLHAAAIAEYTEVRDAAMLVHAVQQVMTVWSASAAGDPIVAVLEVVNVHHDEIDRWGLPVEVAAAHHVVVDASPRELAAALRTVLNLR